MPWMATISDIDEWTGVNQPDAILGDQSIKDFFSPNAVIVIVNHALSLLRLIAFDPNPKLDKQKLRLLCSGCNLPTLMSRLTLTAFLRSFDAIEHNVWRKTPHLPSRRNFCEPCAGSQSPRIDFACLCIFPIRKVGS